MTGVSLGDFPGAACPDRTCSDLLNQAGTSALLRRTASCLMKSADIVEDVEGQESALKNLYPGARY